MTSFSSFDALPFIIVYDTLIDGQVSKQKERMEKLSLLTMKLPSLWSGTGTALHHRVAGQDNSMADWLRRNTLNQSEWDLNRLGFSANM